MKLIYNCPLALRTEKLISDHWSSFFHIQKISWFGPYPTLTTFVSLSLRGCQPGLTSAKTWALDSCSDLSTQGWDPSGGLTYPRGKLMLTFAFRDENLLYEHWLCLPPQPIPHQDTTQLIGSIHTTEWAAGRVYFPIVSSHWGKGYLSVLIDISHVNPQFVNGKKGLWKLLNLIFHA